MMNKLLEAEINLSNHIKQSDFHWLQSSSCIRQRGSVKFDCNSGFNIVHWTKQSRIGLNNNF